MTRSTRIIIDEQVLCERGTSIAAYDYAYNLKRFGYQNIIVIFDRRMTTDKKAQNRFECSFETFGYSDLNERDAFVRDRASIYYYLQIHPDDIRRFSGTKTACHAVFDFLPLQQNQNFAYISQWLSEFLTDGRAPVVPHIVSLPNPTYSLRQLWDIPATATVFGRYGGFESFDIPFVHRAVCRALEERHDLWFVFINTKPFVTHSRVRFLPAIYDAVMKANFIGSCDAMLHGRSRGESFGLAMAEFLSLNKPVLCWGGGRDRNHLWLQPDPENIYWTGKQLFQLLTTFQATIDDHRRQKAVAQFAPDAVIEKFISHFIEGEHNLAVSSSQYALWDFKRRFKNRMRRTADSLLQQIS